MRQSLGTILRRQLCTKIENPLIVHDVNQGVLKLTLNRPKQRNALSMNLLRSLEEQFNILKEDPCKNVRVVLINGNGPAFCSGHDLKEMTNPNSPYTKVMQMIQDIPQPVITAAHGIATAAGLQMVAASDLCVAASDTRFATPGVNIGLFCSTPAVPLVRCVGKKAANDMLLTGRLVSAPEALRMGLISHIDDTGDLLAVAEELALSIAARSGAALAIGKRTLNAQSQLPLGEAYQCASEAMVINMKNIDAQEGIDAFIQKRSPNWRHE